MTANVGKAAEASFIKDLTIASNKDGKSVSLLLGFIELRYYESIMDNTVKATVMYSDSGDTIDGKTARSGLPIVGEEMVSLKIEDNNKNVLDFILGLKASDSLSPCNFLITLHLCNSLKSMIIYPR